MLTLLSFPLVWLATTGLRHLNAPAIVVLGGAGIALVLACGVAIWRLPRIFLGEDGQWMASTLRSFLQKRRGRTGGDRQKVSGAFETARVEEVR